MRILIMVHHLPEAGKKVGGVSVSALRLARELGYRADCQVTVGCIGGEVSEKMPFQVWHPMGEGWLSKLCGTLPGVLILYPILLNFSRFPKVDVINFHGEDWFLLNRPAPVVRTMHGASVRECEYTTNPFRKIVLLFSQILERLSAKLCDRLLCVGTDTMKIFGGSHYIGNGYDPRIFRPGLKASHPVVFFNGYWKGRKRGWFVYQEFINKVLPALPEAELWFLGDECPVHPNVKLLRGVEDSELGQLYRQAWVFAYPSVYEGFGMPYVEAMASGTAIITSPNKGFCDVCDSGKCGVVANDCEFGDQMLNMLRDRTLREQLSSAGKLRARNFTSQRVAGEFLQHFADVIKSS